MSEPPFWINSSHRSVSELRVKRMTYGCTSDLENCATTLRQSQPIRSRSQNTTGAGSRFCLTVPSAQFSTIDNLHAAVSKNVRSRSLKGPAFTIASASGSRREMSEPFVHSGDSQLVMNVRSAFTVPLSQPKIALSLSPEPYRQRSKDRRGERSVRSQASIPNHRPQIYSPGGIETIAVRLCNFLGS